MRKRAQVADRHHRAPSALQTTCRWIAACVVTVLFFGAFWTAAALSQVLVAWQGGAR